MMELSIWKQVKIQDVTNTVEDRFASVSEPWKSPFLGKQISNVGNRRSLDFWQNAL